MKPAAYFTADLHLSHKRILQIANRPFKSIEEHNKEILAAINDTVPTNATLYVLGDVILHTDTSPVYDIKTKNRHLIWGNHDARNVAAAFQSARDVYMLDYPPKIWLSHYAHAYWPQSHRGSYHLYGHTHTYREETLDKLFPQRRSMDVGIDNAYRLLGAYRPFSLGEILEIMKDRTGHDDLSFYMNLEEQRQQRGLDTTCK